MFGESRWSGGAVSCGRGVQRGLGVAGMSSWGLGRPPWREGAGGKDAIVSAFVPQQTRFSGVVGGPVARSRRSKRQKGAERDPMERFPVTPVFPCPCGLPYLCVSLTAVFFFTIHTVSAPFNTFQRKQIGGKRWAHRLVEGEESNQSLDRRKVMQGDTLDL